MQGVNAKMFGAKEARPVALIIRNDLHLKTALGDATGSYVLCFCRAHCEPSRVPAQTKNSGMPNRTHPGHNGLTILEDSNTRVCSSKVNSHGIAPRLTLGATSSSERGKAAMKTNLALAFNLMRVVANQASFFRHHPEVRPASPLRQESGQNYYLFVPAASNPVQAVCFDTFSGQVGQVFLSLAFSG